MAYISPTLGTTNVNVKYRLIATLISTNQLGNSDLVNIQLQAWRLNDFDTYGSGSANIILDGIPQVAQAIVPSQIISLSSYTVLYNANHTIAHNTDGSKRLNIGGYFTINSPVTSSPTWQYYDVDLPVIPRESTITVLDANIEASTIITINKNIPGSTTTLKYSFGATTPKTGTIVDKTASETYGWTVPAEFYEEIPDALSGICTITAETYSGTTLIGTKTATFVATVSSANAPEVSATIEDNKALSLALTGNNKKIVKFISDALFSITATSKNYATIQEKKITCEAKSSALASGTLLAVESNVFTVFTKDSRGLTKTTVYQAPEYTLIPYDILTLDPVIKRSSPTGDTLAYTISGNYFNGSFGAVSNTLKVEYRISEDGGLNWLDGGVNNGWKEITGITPIGNTYTKSGTLSRTGGYDFELQAKVELRATDKIRTISDPLLKNVIVDKGRPAIDYGDDYVNINEVMYLRNTAGTLTNIVNLFYPVGSIYMSTVNTNPNTRFPDTTWVAWGTGRVPVGVDTGQTEFNTVEKTGGAKTHTLTTAEMPSHEHAVSSGAGQELTTNTGAVSGKAGVSANNGVNTYASYKANANGGSGSHNNLQPYITCYMWKRTA